MRFTCVETEALHICPKIPSLQTISPPVKVNYGKETKHKLLIGYKITRIDNLVIIGHPLK
jgi:hypothetical protein